jgi:Fe-S cluster assembly ATP-binding protein
MSVVLDISDLCAEAGGKQVLKGVNLRVGAGETHVIMGPNGSGKSTLAHALMGRPGVTITSGRILVDGHDVTHAPTFERARAGLYLAMQQPIEVPGVSLAATLQAAGVPESQVRGRLEQEATRIGLRPDLLDRALNEDLSGGEAKRTEIVQMAGLRPKVAILDEIDSGLDVDALDAVAKRVKEATTEWNLGVLAITHFRRLLDGLEPNTIHVLADGQIQATGGMELAEQLEASGYAQYR